MDLSITESEAVRKHFANQEAARNEWRKADAIHRIKEALKSRLYPYHDIKEVHLATLGNGKKSFKLETENLLLQIKQISKTLKTNCYKLQSRKSSIIS